jgi:ankyrin repeat protein
MLWLLCVTWTYATNSAPTTESLLIGSDSDREIILTPYLESINPCEKAYALISLGLETKAITYLRTLPHLIAERPCEEDGLNLFHAAIGNCTTNLVAFFISSGADVNALSSSGFTPLQAATSRWGSGNIDTVELLLSHGANPNASLPEFQAPLSKMFGPGGTLDLVLLKVLLAHGADPNIENEKGETVLFDLPLHYPHKDLNEAIKELVDAGADVNHISNNGDTPLHHAMRAYGHLDIVKQLLAFGADPYRCGAGTDSPIAELEKEIPLIRQEFDNPSEDWLLRKEAILTIMKEHVALNSQ